MVGHCDTVTTETIYRFQIRRVVVQGAGAMDRIFPTNGGDGGGEVVVKASYSINYSAIKEAIWIPS